MPTHAGADGLSDPLLLHDRLAQALARCRRSNGLLGLIRIDLEPAADPGAGRGRDVVDAVAARLARELRASDTIARLENDGLAVVLSDLSDGRAAERVADKLAGLLEGGVAVDDHMLYPTVRFGIALAPAHGDNPAELLESAAAAAAHARAAGLRMHRAAGTAERPFDCRHDLAQDLVQAIEQGQLRLEYQPQIEPVRRQPVGFEALLRWRHPDLGEVDPEVFIPLAEANGTIGRIGKWALAEACATAAGWPDGPLGPLRVAVNFSASQMAGDDLPRIVGRALERAALPGARLELELTERSVLDPDERVLAALTGLRAMGVSIALDDFGMGFASLRHLGRLPLDVLKVDRSFVAGIASTTGHAIVRCVVELAHRMRLRVVAEGVEQESQIAILRSLGCDAIQGHAFGQPLRADEVAPWLAKSPSRNAPQ